MSVHAIHAVSAAADSALADPAAQARAHPMSGQSFAQMMAGGLDAVNKNVLDADKMIRAFALDDTVPLHQVMYAVEKARTSFEMALQVRSQLVGVYQEFSRMEL